MMAPMLAPMVANNTTRNIFISPLTAALYAAGGTTTSEGKGINELSMVINNVIVP
jgi:hypothetical protein